jgi:hypothetical protein
MVREAQPQDPGGSGSTAPNEQTANEEAQNEEEKPTEEGSEAKPDESEGEGEEHEGKEDGGEDKGEPSEQEEKRKRAGGWQRKIERLERQNELLLQQLGTQRPHGSTQAAPPGKEKTSEEKAAEYIDNLVEQRLTKREQERQAQSAQAEFQRRTAEVRAAKPDFDDVIMSASDVPVSDGVTQALLTSEHGPAIMYELAKNPAELARISALPPLVAAREIGRLEAKLPSSTSAPKTTKPALRPPVPPTSVNGSTSSARNLDDLPISEYKRAYRSGRR